MTAELVVDLLGPVVPPQSSPILTTAPAVSQSQSVSRHPSSDVSALVEQLADNQERIWDDERARAMRLAQDLREPDEIIPETKRHR
ncbi:hypothetical protein CXG46_13430 [Nocardioides alpinus]|uniref:Addiction module component n=1 Tax=Nocardioides alpinus TaxID=748909 RepID=A0ABX4QVE3_9ACTN|nr:hypothetical protein CXG46_13430 [Nocardioides alpinus]